MNFQMGNIKNNSLLLIFTHTIQTYRLRNKKAHFSSREGINTRRRFNLLLFTVLAQCVTAMTAVVTLMLLPSRLVAGDRSTVTGITPLFIQQTLARGLVFAIVLEFFAYKKNARPN